MTLRARTTRPAKPRLEQLDDRLAPAVITVTGTGDTSAVDGAVTLREAITSINQGSNVNADVVAVGAYGTNDTINFTIPGAGVKTISVTAALPTLVKPVTINGYSQPGASANTLANSDNAVLLIELNGTGAGAGSDGLVLGAGSGGSTVRGLVVNRFPGNGIVVQSNGNHIAGNFVGVNAAGTTRSPNGTFPTSGDGIRVESALNNVIGGTTPADRNVASGNAIDGIHVVGTLAAPATGNLIQGNFVGVAADGRSSVGNRTEPAPAPGAGEGNNLFGIEISGGNNNTVGGTTAGARNVVGLNGAGIEVDNGGQNNVIQGNFSGVGADGVTPAGNLLHGIVLRSDNGFAAPLGPAQANEPGVSNNVVGGTVAGAGNTVAFNGTGGVAVFGNPVSASGQPNVGNTIQGNSIYLNGRSFATASSAPTPLLGIDLTNGFTFPRDDGFTANDSQGHGAANAPNNFQNFPVVTSATASGGSVAVTGTLHAAASTTFRVEFFASDADPLAQPAEGQRFLGFQNVTTDATGNATFTAVLGATAAVGQIVTATATDPVGNTSEFSPGVTVPAAAAARLAVSGPANGQAQVFAADATGQYAATPAATAAFPGFTGQVRAAVGDVNGDGIEDTILATGPGTPLRVAVVNGADNTVLVQPFAPFAGSESFAGGGFVAAANFNSDRAEIVVTPDQGGGPRVSIYALVGTTPTLTADFLGIDDANFRGGARTAVGDVNGDGTPDVAVAAGFLGGPRIALFDGKSLLPNVVAGGNFRVINTPTKLINDFFAFPGTDAQNLRNGAFVAIGDIDGDGDGDLIFGGGPGGAPRVFILSGATVTGSGGPTAAYAAPIANFFVAGNSSDRGGVRVATRNADGDTRADLAVGSGEGSAARVRVYLGDNFTTTGEPTTFQDLSVFGGAALAGGVFVG